MLSDDPLPDSPAAGRPAIESVQALDQMLRRALRVAPRDTADGIDPDTWSAAAPVEADFWGEAVPRPRRWRPQWPPLRWRALTSRVRMVAASALVAALAVGWIATSQMGGARPRSTVARPPAAVASGHAAAARPARVRGPAPADAGRPLRASVPAGALCAYGPQSASEAHCSLGDVDVEYRLVGPDALAAAYFSAIGMPAGTKSPVPAARSGRPRCAQGGEEERSWSRPQAPGRAVGRYACRIEQGRAAMWWTVDDRGLLAHATRPGTDLSSLFAWWNSHAER